MKTKQKQVKIQPKTDACEKAGERTGYVVKTILLLPFLILKGIYVSLFRIPANPACILGFFRAILMFVLIYAIGEMEFAGGYKVHIMHFLSDVFGSEETAKSVMTLAGFVFALNFIASLFVMLGFHMNDRRYGIHSISGNGRYEYSNIEDALNYREAIVSQQSLSGKVAEYGKTAFVNKDTFSSMSSASRNMKDSVQYFNALLGQYSQPGKYQLLKELFSGKK